MSWETVVCGCVVLKDGNTDEVISLLQDILEVDRNEMKIEERSGKKEIYFKSLNFDSHVDEDKVKKFVKKVFSNVDYVGVSLYYLGEADFDFVLCEDNRDKVMEEIVREELDGEEKE
jgi:hypothetical protein